MNGYRSKSSEASNLIEGSDICTLVETKLDSNCSLAVKDYITNRLDRNCNGGGLITFVKEYLKPIILNDLQDKAIQLNLEVTFTSVLVEGAMHTTGRVTIVGAYRPPSSSVRWFEDLKELLLFAVLKDPVILMGDFNADLLKPNQYPGKALLEILSLTDANMQNWSPTRIGSKSVSCLDIIGFFKSITLVQYIVLDVAASDHFPIKVSISPTIKPQLIPIIKRDYKHLNQEELSEKVASIVITEDEFNAGSTLSLSPGKTNSSQSWMT